jgi:zinc finger-like protein
MFPSSSEQSSIENHIESLHKLLYCQKGLPSCKFVEKLCQEMKSLAMDLTKQFIFYETKVLFCYLLFCHVAEVLIQH